jgi:hypothetical protein
MNQTKSTNSPIGMGKQQMITGVYFKMTEATCVAFSLFLQYDFNFIHRLP